MRGRVSAKDLKAGALVRKPDTFLLKITEYREEPGKKDPNTTTAFIFMEIVCNAKGDTEYSGARAAVFPNDKSWGMAPNSTFLPALGAEKGDDGGFDVELDDSIVGQYVEAYIERGKNNTSGADVNAVKEFYPVGTHCKSEVLDGLGITPLVKK